MIKYIISLMMSLMIVSPAVARGHDYGHRNHNDKILTGVLIGAIGAAVIIDHSNRNRNRNDRWNNRNRNDRWNNRDRNWDNDWERQCYNISIDNISSYRGDIVFSNYKTNRIEGERYAPNSSFCFESPLQYRYVYHDVNRNGYFDRGDGFSEIYPSQRDYSAYMRYYR